MFIQRLSNTRAASHIDCTERSGEF